jgi:hypothetical protein
MTYLEIVQFAINRAQIREESPSTLVGATGIVADFANWVADAWVELQMEKETPPWFFRKSLDQTFVTVASDDDYAMPSGLETIDWRTVTAYLTAKTDETPVTYTEYIDWRMELDTRTITENKPQRITQCPDDTLKLWPVPDQVYTIRFDGVLDIDEMSVDADTPTNLPAQYHRMLGYAAIMRMSSVHEDGNKYQDAESKWRPYYDKLVARQLSHVRLNSGQLRGQAKSTVY